jgi:flavin-dependent dehydrogenase
VTASSHADVVIVGGGPAGSATAIALRERGVSTTVVEPGPGRRSRGRVGETVPAEIEATLAQLGLRDEFLHDGHLRACATASSWGTPDLAWRDDFMSALGGGWHLDRDRFDEMLLGGAAQRGARLLRGHRVVGTRRSGPEGWLLAVRALDGGAAELSASFVVDASGRAAVVARRLGAARVIEDDLVCVYAALDAPRASLYPDTLIESTDNGWWYAARLTQAEWTTAFFTDRSELRRRRLVEPQAWQELFAATRHVFPLLGRPAAPKNVQLVSARSQRLAPLAGDHWLAVGDAAMAWDPITSAGIVQALRFGLRAGEAVTRSLGGDAGAGGCYQADYVSLQTRYVDERRAYYSLERRWPDSPFWQRGVERRRA